LVFLSRVSPSIFLARLPPSSTLFPYTTLFRSAIIVRSQSELLRGAPRVWEHCVGARSPEERGGRCAHSRSGVIVVRNFEDGFTGDRKSTRLNSSHVKISYAVFCLKNKTRHG